jgi:RimJ/RimL family protein N-acetyltransferase
MKTAEAMAGLDLVIRDLEMRDAPVLAEFFGPSHREALAVAGWLNPERFPLEEIVAAAKQGAVEAWIFETSDGQPVALALYQVTGFPGVWTFEGTISARYSGSRGAGTAAGAAGLNRLFAGHPEIVRVMGYVAVTNLAARRVCDKLGFIEEGRAREHLELQGGARVDAWLMGLLVREWQSRQAAA